MNGSTNRWAIAATWLAVMATATTARGTARSRDASVRAMVRQALDDANNGEAISAENRLHLAMRSCRGNHCSNQVAATVHIALGELIAVARDDRLGAQREFAEALRLDGSAQLDAFANDTARVAFDAAGGTAIGGDPSREESVRAHAPSGGHAGATLGDACSADSDCGGAMHCSEGACASGERGASPADSPGLGSASSGRETYTVAVDLGGGVGVPLLPAGMPQYAECGAPQMASACLPIASAGFGVAGIVAGGIRVNASRRVGLQAYVQYQPDSSSVGILPNLFFGGRLLVALNSNGFVRRGVSIAAFVGSGYGQMQATPPGASAHVVSGLNNVNVGARLEYGLGVIHLGAELAFNFQFPNFLFVPDVTAFAGVHF